MKVGYEANSFPGPRGYNMRLRWRHRCTSRVLEVQSRVTGLLSAPQRIQQKDIHSLCPSYCPWRPLRFAGKNLR